MVEFACSRYKAGKRVMNNLQLSNVLFGYTIKERVAVVQPCAHNAAGNGLQQARRKRRLNVTESSYVVVAALANVANVRCKA